MSKRKNILIIGVILLFVGLSFAPATASILNKEKTETINFGILDENGKVSRETISLSSNKVTEVSNLLYELSEKIQNAKSEQNFMDIIDNFIKDKRVSKFPFLTMLLKRTVRSNGILSGSKLRSNIGLGTRQSFIMSFGSTNRLPFITKEQTVDISRPLTFWRYGGSRMLLKSRTVIVERAPFHIETFSGRQLGFMRGFAGFYIERDSLLSDKSYTFFIGRAVAVRGFDFSLLNGLSSLSRR